MKILLKGKIRELAIIIISFILGLVVGGVGLDEYYAKPNSQWEVRIEDYGYACTEYTKGGSRVTSYVLSWEQEEGSEICHGNLVEARRRWEIRSESN